MNQETTRFSFGGKTVELATGKIAKQADGAVMASVGDTSVLCTVVAQSHSDPNQEFFPLTVDYQERYYATGRIPGSFFRREGRPSEKEVLTSRLIDRPIRPLFPDGFLNEVHVVPTVMSSDPEYDPDIIAMLGASAALSISGVPFAGPIGAARVGLIDGLYVTNPSYKQLEQSGLNMVVAGTKSAVLMVESEADELSEDQMLGAVLFAHEEMQVAIDSINELVERAGKPRWIWSPPPEDAALDSSIKDLVENDLGNAYRVTNKTERLNTIRSLRTKVADVLSSSSELKWNTKDISASFAKLEKRIVRTRALNGDARIDGRGMQDVRPIYVEVGFLPKVHGSALFQRGETQAICTTTLGTLRDAALVDAIEGKTNDTFLLHYNFPPYSVGETGFMSGPKRREIGHGRLARRGIATVLPKGEDFPYTVRVVSEITESNGSSSMASVCGASLSLMDAGVPIRTPVAGVAMGLIKEGDSYAILTDILGDEDHLGDMDFKVAGTANGVNALQMDIKVDGINEEIMEVALEQARVARICILESMNVVISRSRDTIADTAPSIIAMKINPDKIREVIGKGGNIIRSIQEQSGTDVELDDSGHIRIYAPTRPAGEAAKKLIEDIVVEPEEGKVYEGEVQRIMDFGAFVKILPNYDGLLHISEITKEHVNNVEDYVQVGNKVTVVCTSIDNQGRARLSIKRLGEYANESAM